MEMHKNAGRVRQSLSRRFYAFVGKLILVMSVSNVCFADRQKEKCVADVEKNL